VTKTIDWHGILVTGLWVLVFASAGALGGFVPTLWFMHGVCG
jgi:hypothetical protein